MKQVTTYFIGLLCLILAIGNVQAQIDLELSIDQQTPGSTIVQYENHFFVLTARNTGTDAASNITIELPESDDRGIKVIGAFSVNPEAGTFVPVWNGAKNVGTWTIPSIAAGGEVFMNVILYIGVAPADINLFAQVTGVDQTDCDSTPNNKSCCDTATEDDEVIFPDLADGSLRGGCDSGDGGGSGGDTACCVWTKGEDSSIFYADGPVGIGVKDPDADLEIISDQINLSLGGNTPSMLFKYLDEDLNFSAYELRGSKYGSSGLSLEHLEFSVTDGDILASSLIPLANFGTSTGTIFHEDIAAPKLTTPRIMVQAPLSYVDDLVNINNLGVLGAEPEYYAGYGLHLDLDGKYYMIGAHSLGETGGIEVITEEGIAGYFSSLDGTALVVPSGNVGIGVNDPASKLTVKTEIRSINNLNNTAALLYTSSNNGSLRLYGANESTNFWATNTATNTGYAGVYNGDSRAKAYLTISGDAGVVRTFGTNNRENVQLTYVGGYPNHGYVLIEDAASVQQAGMYINSSGQGVVFGDTKSFRIPHPEEPGKEIWYASLEGPEAAAYERGTAKLRNGEAFVEFSDHFKLVISEENMTVIVTPHSADTYGLAVIEKTAKGIRVKELMNRKGNFSFDWEVKAVRKGHEKFRVIRDADELRPGSDDKAKAFHHAPPVEETSAVPIPKPQSKPAVSDEHKHKHHHHRHSNAWLGQASPNPSAGQVIIPFFIEEQVQEAILQIIDTDGNILEQRTITERGKGEAQVQLDQFESGNYFYMLVLDGKHFDSHQLAVVR